MTRKVVALGEKRPRVRSFLVLKISCCMVVELPYVY